MQLDVLMSRIQKQLVAAPDNGGVLSLEIIKDKNGEYSIVNDPSCGYDWVGADAAADNAVVNRLIALPEKPVLLLPDERCIAITEWRPHVAVSQAVMVMITGYMQQLKVKASPNAADTD